ncbi:MAG: extracellular solute-binding protein [Ruthenibacterium sp.]
MKGIKKALALTLSLTMLTASFTACAPKQASSAAAPASASASAASQAAPQGKKFDGITVQFASCHNEAEQSSIWEKELAAEWEKETGGTIKFNYAGRDVLTSVKSDLLVGNAPDIITQDLSELAAALITKDEILLEPLNDVLDGPAAGETTPIKDNLNGAYTLFRTDGKDYFVPFMYITSGFFYNKTMFKDLGITAPTTWDEFIKVCETIEKSDIPALAADGNISFYNCYYLQAACQRILGSGEFLKAALDPTGAAWDNPGFLEAAKYISELSAKGKNFFQDGYAGTAYPAGQTDWATGGAGMVYCGSWLPVETQDLVDDKFEFGFFAFPTIDGGKGITTDIEAQMMGFCVPKDAKNKDAAKDFIAYCTSKKAADRLVETNANMSARTDAIYPPALIEVKPFVDASTAYHKNYDGAMSAAPEWWANVFYPADDALFFGKISPEEFIAQIKAETIKFYENKK